MLKPLKQLTLAAALLAANATCLHAQVFVTPNAPEFTFGDPAVGPAERTSCYSLEAGYAYFPGMASILGSGSANLYVATWNNQDVNGLQEVTVMLSDPSNPANVLWKFSIPYSSVRDLEVASMRNPATNSTDILVAGYKEGSGHILDIYALNPSTTTPYTLVDHKVLSNSPTYGRIRMDGHATYDCAIAWVNTKPGPDKGIQTMVYTGNAWSGIKTLSGTANKTGVDIAMSQVNGSGATTLYPLHFVYSGGGFVTLSTVDMSTVATAATATVTPTLIDNNYVGAGLNSSLMLDCADFSTIFSATNPSAWAYTYSDGMNVIVRHRNPTLPAAQTVVVTSGMLGNSPLDPAGAGYKVFSPTINYGGGYPGPMPEEIMVAWYATDGAGNNGYMAIEMDVNGTVLNSTPDYLLLPNANTPTMPANFSSGIALSKIGPKAVHNYLYATYYDVDPSTGKYQLHHAFHKWGDVVFKGNDNTGLPAVAAIEDTRISAYPNPFLDVLNTFVSLREDGRLHLELHDMAGRLVWQYEASLTKGRHQLKADDLKKLTAGTYMLTASLNGKRIDTKMIAKQ